MYNNIFGLWQRDENSINKKDNDIKFRAGKGIRNT